MDDRAKPPDDISPARFFVEWIPQVVARDEGRGRQLGETQATIVFVLTGPATCEFTLEIAKGEVIGSVGAVEDPNLVVTLAIDTWRSLNRGDLSAPEALLYRRLQMKGDMMLALKLHLILG